MARGKGDIERSIIKRLWWIKGSDSERLTASGICILNGNIEFERSICGKSIFQFHDSFAVAAFFSSYHPLPPSPLSLSFPFFHIFPRTIARQSIGPSSRNGGICIARVFHRSTSACNQTAVPPRTRECMSDKSATRCVAFKTIDVSTSPQCVAVDKCTASDIRNRNSVDVVAAVAALEFRSDRAMIFNFFTSDASHACTIQYEKSCLSLPRRESTIRDDWIRPANSSFHRA